MTLPDLNDVCIQVPIDTSFDTSPLSIQFPGGLNLQGQMPFDVSTKYDVSRALLQQLNGALGPLAPIFDVLQALIDIKNALTEVPSVVTNPPKYVKTLEAVGVSIDKVVGLIPQLSVPKLIKGCLQMLVTLLGGISEQLTAMGSMEVSANLAAERSATLQALPNGVGTFAAAQLMVAVGCTRATLSAQIQGMQQGLGPAATLLELLNGVAQVVGLKIPGLPSLDETVSISANLAPLAEAVKVLQTIEEAIPL